MGDDDVEQPPHQHGGRGHHFREGSRVEVLTNDDDMGGVYFSATVIRPPAYGRRTQKRGRLYVKYDNLLATEDRPDRLREYVDLSSVRPAPPSLAVTKRFKVNDVVNALYNDGWWKGIVSCVVEGGDGERFVVIFENPPDERQFRALDLRPHWDWVNGVWAGLENLGDVVFAVGEKVEVSFEGDDAWFPAVIARDLENGGYLVEFKDKNGSLVKSVVDCANVRPCPPVLEEMRFGVSEIVDAFFDFGWWRGLITEKKVKDNKNGYNVFFENLNLDKVFDVLEVRAHMDWKDGKWFVACLLTSNLEIPSFSLTKRRSDSKGRAALKKHKGENEHANQETEHLAIVKFVPRDEDPKFAPRDEDPMMRVENVEDLQTPSVTDGSRPVPQSLVSSVLIDEDPMMRVKNVEDIKTPSVTDGSSPMPQSLVSSGLIDEDPMMRVKIIEDIKTPSVTDGSSPVPQSLVSSVLIDEDPMMRVENVEDIQTPSVTDGSSPLPQSLVSSVFIDEGSIAPNERANQEIEPLAIKKIVRQDENPMVTVEIVSVKDNIDGSNLVPQSSVSSVSIDEGSIAPKEVLPDSGWPFVKHSVLWKNIESMEVFRKIPQKPHFQPLSLVKEPEREGLAIGFIVTFSDAVERSCSLKICDPKCVVKNLMEELNPTLSKLENHGFDLGMVRDRMMKLLEAKDKEEKLVEHKNKKSKIDGEIQVMKDNIRRLQEQLELAQVDNTNEVQQIAHLQAELDQIQQQIDQQ